MVNRNEHRLEFINEILDDWINGISSDMLLTKLNKYMCTHLNDGKLYKYRTFDKDNYSLTNLREGTLYCSSPRKFNDPFDCKVGIDLKSFFQHKFEKMLIFLESCVEEYVKTIFDEEVSNKYTNEKLDVINKLRESNIITNFIKELIEKELNEEEVIQLLLNNKEFLKELSAIIFQYITNLNTENYGEFVEKFFNETDLSVFSKSISEEGSYSLFAKSLNINDDLDEISLTGKMYQKLYPDKAEMVIKFDEDLTIVSKQLEEYINDFFRIGCLCEDFKNKLMWSHYADSHEGFCIEYDFSNITKEIKEMLILPVVYSKVRPKIPWELTLPIEQRDKKMTDEANKNNILSLLTKDDAWEYEKEWRIISLSSLNIDNIKMPTISCVYLGAMCSEENKQKIISIANEKNIPVKQMVVDRGQYELHAKSLIERMD